MQNNSTEYKSMTLIDSDTKNPKVRINLENGDELILDNAAVHRMAHAMYDWVCLLDDMRLDRIHHERNGDHGV